MIQIVTLKSGKIIPFPQNGLIFLTCKNV